MSLLWLVRAGLLLAVSMLLLEGTSRLVARGRISAASACRFAYFLIAVTLALPFTSPSGAAGRVFAKPPVQVWASPTMRRMEVEDPVLSVTEIKTSAPISDLRWIVWLWLGAALLRGLWLLVDLARLRGRLARCFVVRKLGRVRVLVSGQYLVPFSLRTPGKLFVVLPQSSLEDSAGVRTVLRHELQHHRQGDTLWAWWLEALKVLFAIHPAAWLLTRRVTEFQELACDRALLGRGVVGPQAYSRCLLKVAETALSSRGLPACAAGMASTRKGAFLHRRITMLFDYEKRSPSPWLGRVSAVIAVSTLLVASSASGAWVRDRRITFDLAKPWVAPRKGAAFPLPLNARVLKQLNRYLGTPDGREFLRQALQRKESYTPILEAKLKEYGVPRELLAVALMESGFRNYPASANPIGAAGLWQFMPDTARNYNLRVDDKVDERLNALKETDAAFRLLKALHLQFEDWGLALLGYNAGENFVQRAIRKGGTRDVWKLIDAGFFNDNEYVEKIMAGAIVLNNPSVLD